MAFHSGDKRAACFFAIGLDAAKSIEREFGIDRKELFVAKKYRSVDRFAAREAVLRCVLRRWQGVLKQPFKRDFAQDAARLGSAQHRFERLLRVTEPTADFLKFAKLFVDAFHHALRALQLLTHGGLTLG